MKIALFGLGNVGLVAALGLCEQGHEVVGVEINPDKFHILEQGQVYIHEDGLQELLNKHRESFRPTVKVKDVSGAECFIVCVGTPPTIDGGVHLEQINTTVDQIVDIIPDDKDLTVIIRSTLPPGTMRSTIFPKFNSKPKVRVVYHPEFLREGTAVKDFLQPHLHVVGVNDHGDHELVKDLFVNAPETRVVQVEAAEMLKYMNNSFHALKVAFANEMASLASSFSVDINDLMGAFLTDRKLNISEKYLSPGFSFGGPCLTKELKAIANFSKSKQVDLPLLGSVLESNNQHLFRTLKAIEKLNPKRILFFGVSFKPNTDDLRSSPIIDLINLLSKGPSYVKKPEIYIRDNASVFTKKEVMSHKTLSSCSQLMIAVDLVVLGTFMPTEEDKTWLSKFEGTILDLGFLKTNFTHAAKTTYRAYEVL